MRLLRHSPTRTFIALLGAALTATLFGCGGSLDGHNYDLTAQTPPSLAGTVALGAPLLDATVSVQDANGVVVSVPVERDGSYGGLSLAGLAAPLSLRACGSLDGKYGCHDGVIDADGIGTVRPLAP
jgi:hypothetical protein